YHPDRDGVVWREGNWAQKQPGWTWVPDRWVRQSDGWTFQEGYWVRSCEEPVERADASAEEANTNEEIGIIPPAGAGPTVVRDGITYSYFQTYGNPYAFGYGGLGITPAYTGVPLYGYPLYPKIGYWGYPNYGWGYGGIYGYPYGFGYGGWGGWG